MGKQEALYLFQGMGIRWNILGEKPITVKIQLEFHVKSLQTCIRNSQKLAPRSPLL